MGPDVGLARGGSGGDPRRRLHDPLPPLPPPGRPLVLGRRSPSGSAILARPATQMTARWHLGPIGGFLVLVAARHLARDPGLPLLHDHRPEDGTPRRLGPRRSTPSRSGIARTLLIAAADRVRVEGRAALVAGDHLHRPDRAAALPRPLPRLSRRALVLACAGGLAAYAAVARRREPVASRHRRSRRAPRRCRGSRSCTRPACRRSSTPDGRRDRARPRDGSRPAGAGAQAARPGLDLTGRGSTMLTASRDRRGLPVEVHATTASTG